MERNASSSCETSTKSSRNTHHYQINQNEVVTVVKNGVEHQYRGTIRASSAGPQGPCQGVAVNSGKHSYICVACDALTRGQTSPLNRRVSRDSTPKHPRSEKLRATQSGVFHKFMSTAHLEAALQSTKTVSIIGQQKIDRLIECNKKLLSQKWHNSHSIRPFVETIVSLLQQNKLSQFDLSFLENWMKKKLKGRYARADEQARKLTILYSNKLGEKLYTTTAPLLGLPCARQAQKICAKEIGDHHYLPGINNWALDVAIKNDTRPLQNGMDGT